MYLTSIEQIRKIQWGRAHDWDIKFEDPKLGEPFNQWFPASDVEENIATLQTFQFEGGIWDNLQIPKSTTPCTLKVTFYDDEKHTLLNWLDNWINKEILNDGEGVSPLEDCIKIVTIAKLDSMKNPIHLTSYYVFPEGEITFAGKSTAEAHVYTMNFIIAGTRK